MANSGMNMSESLGMTGSEPRELKLGPSFLKQGPLYHTIRYDFKPASVDIHKMATVEVNDKNAKEVLVTVPHADGAGVPHTVFKGNQSPIRRDCVLIIDKVTGEITLEKLHTNIIVKKTRPESSAKLSLPHPDVISSRKLSPKHIKGRGNASPKTPGLGCIPKHSPLHASPNPSLPIIGEEMDSGYEASTSGSHSYSSSVSVSDVGVPSEAKEHHPVPPQEPSKQTRNENVYKAVQQSNVSNTNGMEDLVGVLSDSSSGDSSSDVDSSDSSSEAETPRPTNQGRPSGVTSLPGRPSGVNSLPGRPSGVTSLPGRPSGVSLQSAVTLLSDDLQLSDSGSDSD